MFNKNMTKRNIRLTKLNLYFCKLDEFIIFNSKQLQIQIIKALKQLTIKL